MKLASINEIVYELTVLFQDPNSNMKQVTALKETIESLEEGIYIILVFCIVLF